jgi:hypothetical protein
MMFSFTSNYFQPRAAAGIYGDPPTACFPLPSVPSTRADGTPDVILQADSSSSGHTFIVSPGDYRNLKGWRRKD